MVCFGHSLISPLFNRVVGQVEELLGQVNFRASLLHSKNNVLQPMLHPINAYMHLYYKGLWPIVSHLVHTNATRGGCSDSIYFQLQVYCSAIYPQGMKSKYGLGGRLGLPLNTLRAAERGLTIMMNSTWEENNIWLSMTLYSRRYRNVRISC